MVHINDNHRNVSVGPGVFGGSMCPCDYCQNPNTECTYDIFSSRICERGTKGCNVVHEELPASYSVAYPPEVK